MKSIILDNLRTDLAEYLGVPYGLANKTTMEVAGDKAKKDWEFYDPLHSQVHDNPYEAVNEFYMRTRHYLAECTDWHDRDNTVRHWTETLVKHAKELRWESVLDYGAGIATHSLVLAEQTGLEVVIADFDCPAMQFALWKAEKYQLPVTFITFDPTLPVQPVDKPYDCIICTDVVGHSLYPYDLLAEVLTHCRYTLWNSDFRVSSTDRYPMHQEKPRMWDKTWTSATVPIAPFLFHSLAFGHNAKTLAERWKLIERLN